jgi:hypothetical protein
MRMTPEEFHTWSQRLQFSKQTEALIAAIRSSPRWLWKMRSFWQSACETSPISHRLSRPMSTCVERMVKYGRSVG